MIDAASVRAASERSICGGALGAIFRGRISQARPHLGRSLRAFLIPCVYRICDFV